MQFTTGALSDAANTVAQAGTMIQKAADTKQSESILGRAAGGMSALTLGARLLPAVGRLLRRSPFLGSLLITGTIGTLILLYSRRERA